MAGNQNLRMGGRNARKAKRAAVLPANLKPVKSGQESGRYLPLKEEDLPRVSEAIFEVLETIGLGDATDSCKSYLTAVGCTVNEQGRVLFPREVVEANLAKASREITLHGITPEHDLDLSGKRVHFGTAGAAVHVVDALTREYRESTLKDLYDIARLCDTLEHIHFFQRPLVCRDLQSSRELDINTCYASIAGTQKHVGTSFTRPENVEEVLKMLHMISGGEDKWRERSFVSQSNCFVVPPLKFAQDACDCLEAAVKGGMPVLLLSAGQAGATSPASLGRSVVQAMAEVVAGMVYVNAIEPGAPAILGSWPFVSDLRTGAMSGGSGEQAILMAACGQMGNYFNLPTGISAGMSDSKIPDNQSGYEKGYTVTLAAHTGTNMIYEAAGMQASLLGCCPESYVIDNDMLGAINRTVRGIEINDEELDLQPLKDVCLGGQGHYLGHAQTLSRMQKDYLYPEVGDRENINIWIERGSKDIVQRANLKVQNILKTHFPSHWDDALDEELRKQFPIKLPKLRMAPANLQTAQKAS